MLDLICQFWMVIFGVGAILFTTLNGKIYRKLGVVIGLLSQPSFIITAYIHDQMGLFILAWIYTLVWINGILVQFFNINIIEHLFKRKGIK